MSLKINFRFKQLISRLLRFHIKINIKHYITLARKLVIPIQQDNFLVRGS
jgi:hypothetical protein